MKRNLLIIEDDESIRKMLSMYFKGEGFNILEADNGEDAIKIFELEKIDMIFLDIMLPEVDGLRVCEYLRETSDVPIIMLTAKSQEEDKIRGFEYGADEYVTKPFSLKVLAAKTHAIIKRVEGNVSKSGSIFDEGGLFVNFINGEVRINENKIELTRKEFDLLMLLIQNRGTVLSKEIILDKVWGFDYDGDPRTVDTHIRRVRKKLDDKSNFIKTMKGRGYIFDVNLDAEE